MLAVLLAGLLVSAAPDAVEQARTDFERGAALYRAGSYREALAAFEEAQARSPAPQALFNIARCHERLGEFADAVEAYRAYVEAAPGAPDRATRRWPASTSCSRRLPLEASLRVAVEPPAVGLGGRRQSPALAGLGAAPPGAHRVSARRSGYGPVDRDVELAPGARVQLELSLVPLVAETAQTRAPEGAVRDTVGPAPRTGERRWTYVAAGLAAVSLAAGLTLRHQRPAGPGHAARRHRAHRRSRYSKFTTQPRPRTTAANSFYIAAGRVRCGGDRPLLPRAQLRSGHRRDAEVSRRAWAALAAVGLLAACRLDLTGAACHDDSNCPVRQYCARAITEEMGVCRGRRPAAVSARLHRGRRPAPDPPGRHGPGLRHRRGTRRRAGGARRRCGHRPGRLGDRPHRHHLGDQRRRQPQGGHRRPRPGTDDAHGPRSWSTTSPSRRRRRWW